MASKIRLEGFTLTVRDVSKSVAFYCGKLGFTMQLDAAPHFALLCVDGSKGTVGLLAWSEAKKDGCAKMTKSQTRAVHVELSTDNLDKLYEKLLRSGVKFHTPPHDEPWERSMTALDPDGYSVEFAQGRRGKNATKKTAVRKEKKASGAQSRD